MPTRVLKYVSVIGLAFWMGGIAFYGGVAVPLANGVLDTHLEIGLVTRLVTRVSNLVGIGVLALLAAHGAAAWKTQGRIGRGTLAISWLVLVAAQVALFLLWGRLDSMLDVPGRRIAPGSGFYGTHERYMELTGVACLAALVHLWALLSPPRAKA